MREKSEFRKRSGDEVLRDFPNSGKHPNYGIGTSARKKGLQKQAGSDTKLCKPEFNYQTPLWSRL